jgi:predicted acyltransferase
MLRSAFMASPTSDTPSSRLSSLDALRGFDMLWIIGADVLIHRLAAWKHTPWLETWSASLRHVKWEGLAAYDLIFPLFMFLSGVAIPFSLDSRIGRGDSKAGLLGKILLRTALLVILGMLYNGFFAGPGEGRVASVLGQIGMAWGCAALVHVFIGARWMRMAIIPMILLIVAGLQLLYPVPGHGAGVLTQAGSFNAWIDRGYLPGRLHEGIFDPEGLICVFSAISVTLAGAVAGSHLRGAGGGSLRLAGSLFAAGAAATIIGWVCWKLGYPPIKALWTSTFDLLAMGISLMTFALFYGVIDVLGLRAWSFPLRVIGMNSLGIYLIGRFFSFERASTLLLGRWAASLGEAGPVVIIAGVLVLQWLLLYLMFRKRIFVKV